MVDKNFIESLGWVHVGKSVLDWFEMDRIIQPNNLTFRYLGLRYGYSDNYLKIIGYEYGTQSEEEVLFDGNLVTTNKVEEFKLILNQTGVIR